MAGFSWRGRSLTGKAALDTGIANICIAELDGRVYAYAATGAQGGLAAWRLAEGRAPALVDSVFFHRLPGPVLEGGLAVLDRSDRPFLAVGSGEGTLSGVRLQANGLMGDLTGLPAPGLPAHVVALTGAEGQVFAAGPDSRIVALTESGETYRGGDAAVFGPGGITAMAVLRTGGQSRLYIAGSGVEGVTVFDLTRGRPVAEGTVGAAAGLGVSAPTELAAVSLMGRDYLVLAAAGSSSISVLEAGPDGSLAVRDHIIDSLHSRFAHVQTLDAVVAEGHVFVLAAGSDDGVSLFRLLPGGRLLHLAALADAVGAGLSDIRALAAARIGEELQVLAASESSAGLARLDYNLGDLGLQKAAGAGGGRLAGGDGDDVLAGGGGADRLEGGAGADILLDGGGADTLRGGAGADVFVFVQDGATDRIVDFTLGEDRLDLSGFWMLYDPKQLDIDTVGGGAVLRWGDERIEIRSADNARLSAEEVRTAILAGPDRPPLAMERETLGTDGHDTLSGFWGSDVLAGFSGADRLDGGGGDDRLFGGDQDDLLLGGAGNDAVTGGNGRDRGYLGPGHDVFFDNGQAGEFGRDSVWGGHGNDTVEGGGGNDMAAGEWGDDLLLGRRGSDTLFGGEGADTLAGGDDEDRLFGGAGDDLLFGGAQGDRLAGGAGRDTVVGGNGPDVAYLGAGDDIFHDNGQGEGHGRDTVWAGEGDDTIEGGAGDDLFAGERGNDAVRGRRGVDTLFGGDGRDTLDGGDGEDLLIGGAGDDLLFGGRQGDRLEGRGGRDTVVGGDGPDLVFLGPGGDIFHDNAQGGVHGRDTVWAGHGDDTIRGGAGDDLFGGEWGNDVLRGGAGADRLYGGEGADVFVFRPGDGTDRIGDFTPGTDRLHLDHALWGGGLAPAQVVARFVRAAGPDLVLDFGQDLLVLEGRAGVSGLDDDIDIF